MDRLSGKKRRYLVGFCLIMLAGVCAWFLATQVRQEQLNHALLVAIQHNEAQKVGFLLAEGADPNTHEDDRQGLSIWNRLLCRLRGQPWTPRPCSSALLAAFQAWWKPEGGSEEPPENTAIVTLLLSRRVDVNCQDAEGVTPLMEAAMSGRAELVKQLLSKGAEVNARDVCDNTALDYVNGGFQHPFHYPHIADLLKQAGAKE